MKVGPYSFLTLFAVFGILAGITPLALAWLWAKKFSPRKSGPVKNANYECGLDSKATGWVQFQSEYYLYGIVFLVFDVESIFLLPFAAAFKGLPVGACIGMLLFVLLLVEGLVWLCVKGVVLRR